MMSLGMRQTRSPAPNSFPCEELHASHGRNTIAHSTRKAKKKARNVWRLGSLNVRSMVDMEGPIEVASQGTEWGKDRKVDLVVSELARYNRGSSGDQVVWLWEYEVGDSIMVLTSGRSKPGEGQLVQRGEGLAIVLRGQALAAWRLEGQQWKAWSVTAVFQVGKRSSSRMHLVSRYAPTRATTREVKDAFFQELENIFSSIPSGELYVLLGDFNARVGSRESPDEEWGSMRGPHELGCANDSGKELLSFLAVHQAMVCNT